jgi:hypothetical protein
MLPRSAFSWSTPAQLCHYESGNWYGADPDGGTSYDSCCAVKGVLYDLTNAPLQLLPIDRQAVRDDNYKSVRKSVEVCGTAPNTNDMAQTVNEFYKIAESAPIPIIDKDGTALCEGTACPSGLSQAELKAYNQLTALMNATLASDPACPGDGNEDKAVNLDDVANWFYFSTNGVPQQKG